MTSIATMPPTHFLYRAATGGTVVFGDHTCCLCGSGCRNPVDVKTVIRDTFTNHGMLRVPESTDVCPACDYYFNHRWDAGQKYLSEFRKRSLLVTPDGWTDWQRPDMKRDIEHWLQDGCPEGIFVIALSKKKHLLPLAPINPPGRVFRIQFELDTVEVSKHYWPLASAFCCLMGLGAKKGEILSGDYHHSTLRKCPSTEAPDGRPASIKTLMDLDATIRPWRPSPLLSLVSYIILEEHV